MVVYDQSEVIEFLMRSDFYGADGPVERIDTHISSVFLVGERAYKLKRAVLLPYVDFSTPELRLACCRKEVALNSPSAPELYVGVRAITRDPSGKLGFDGQGRAVDWVVEMRRFEQRDVFDQMAMSGDLTPARMKEVAQAVAAFHASIPVVHSGSGTANIAGVLAINDAGFATSSVFSPVELSVLSERFRAALGDHAALLDAREVAGAVRRCHGDLHLRNICMWRGVPRLFDRIDFNDQIATVDTLYDLAFLLMDLWHRDLPDLANLTANSYLDLTRDEAGFVLLPFFMALRAAVRAHVTATQASGAVAGAAPLAETARSYFDLAGTLLAQVKPRLVAIGGLSGTGKTTLAEVLGSRLGPPPGARILESDRTRKSLFGVTPEVRLPPSAYASEVSDRVYQLMSKRAESLLCAGATVLVDAVYDQEARRASIADVAKAAGVAFTGFWLSAPLDVLRTRVSARLAGPSDATLQVLETQIGRDTGEIHWTPLDSRQPPQALAAMAEAAITAGTHSQLNSAESVKP